jgi:hypothetical protein
VINPAIEQDLRGELEKLPAEQQRRVLDYARELVARQPRGVAGESLVGLAGTLDAQGAAEMTEAIEQGCEHVNLDGW